MKDRICCLKHIKLEVKFLRLLFVMLLSITAVDKNVVKASEYAPNSNLLALVAGALFIGSEKKFLPEFFEAASNDQRVNVYYGSDVSTNFLPQSLYAPGKFLKEQTAQKQKIEDDIAQREQMMKIIINCEEASEDTHYFYLQSQDGITPEERREIESRLGLGQDEDENCDDSKLAPAFSLLSVNGSDSFPLDTSLYSAETAAACQTIQSGFISCILPGATEGGGAATDHNTADGEASEPGSEGFSCHELTYTRQSDVVARSENDECPVCLEPYKPEGHSEVLSLLKCCHVIHKKCLDDIVNQAGGNPKCPSCRAPFASTDVGEHSDWKSLEGSLLVQCKRPSCFAHGSRDTVNSPSMACPYPMSQLNKDPEDFFQKNDCLLAMFLKRSFEQVVGIKVGNANIATDVGTEVGEGAHIQFRILYRSGSKRKEQYLIYCAEDINKKEDGQECFNTLVKDHFTDLMVIYMKMHFPATWNDMTEIYLSGWNVYEDFLNVSIRMDQSYDEIQLKLSNVFDLKTRTLKWDGLRKELEGHGLPYEKLFSSGRGIEYRYRGDSASEEPAVEIPSGEVQVVEL
ncbi:RING finger protein [Endozoicomonas gorgoniicola]|uniref:RING finger protein n=1 Tax=Endozoicomonas gorgoniicola TaxID=1234144 RepID=A0ABT3MRG3_9GAMM|nr:RING finger protein [Endozoicomonas gorgoniicola]MCW7551937.1 RING finger protein [Endozoicomonas gorgoniicola]